MNLSYLLAEAGLDPATTLVMRHTPQEKQLARVLPWLAAEQPDLFNAYQQIQPPKAGRAMEKATFLVSGLGLPGARLLFAGVYRIGASRLVSRDEYWQMPGSQELRELGHDGFAEGSNYESMSSFDLELTNYLADWKGKLILGWPMPHILWYRMLDKAIMPVRSLLEESQFARALPDWTDLDLSWTELKVLPGNLRAALAQWRGIYFIFDRSIAKGYVGSASGQSNLLGRWENYGASGHGGNRLLQERDPENFRFTILQRVSPDMIQADIVAIENSWKERLHTRTPFGLNDN